MSNQTVFSFPCALCGRKITWEIHSEAEGKMLKDAVEAKSMECGFCMENLTNQKEGRIFRKVSPEKLSYVVQELRKKGIQKPRVRDVVIIFEARGWKISQSQAWNYKKMSEAEIQ